MAREGQGHPRDLAVRVLTRVLSDHEPLDEAIAALSGQVTSPQARAWLQEVCSGTLRWKGRLDQAIDSTALKKKPSGWLRKVLLVAAYQLIVQDRAPVAAVVSETVSEIKRKEGEAPAKFANAALRKIAEHARSWRELELSPSSSDAEAAAWASLPEWLWKRLCRDHGREWAVSYARASLDRPVTWIRSLEPVAGEWAEPGSVPGAYRVLEGGAITDKPGFKEGRLLVQDISSQALISEVAAIVLGAGGGRRALDLCAAPGGKSVGLAWSGFEVSASDRDPARYALLEATVARAAARRVHVIARDQVAGLVPQDLVWVDAPCSGTGILRRHPDVRWLRRESELEGLKKVQQELLAEAWGKVRPGGWLVYSVCSVLKEEGVGALSVFADRCDASGAGILRQREWFLVPQQAPFGDGFWCGLVRRAN